MTPASRLQGIDLDYWVARALNYRIEPHPSWASAFKVMLRARDEWLNITPNPDTIDPKVWSPSTKWEHGGPLIEEHFIDLVSGFSGPGSLKWTALMGPHRDIQADPFQMTLSDAQIVEYGKTALQAAMRLFVAWQYPKVLGMRG